MGGRASRAPFGRGETPPLGALTTGEHMSFLTNDRRLLLVTAVIEGATAAGLLIVPALMLGALFGQTGDGVFSLLLAGLFGAALVPVTFLCWTASNEAGGPARPHVIAMLLYNLIVAALLAYSGAVLGLAGFGLWPAVVAHSLLAIGCVAGLAQERRNVVKGAAKSLVGKEASGREDAD